ncbi:hypothetical protein F8388_023897 [Cannabis sativa]|uniref:Chaperonin-like RbcX protein n=1 Tax=Cannabis sativa TaxID=3483 RepID=A0A7J6EUL2_CANSA|nr:hypothetical protein F8388_023897 [Cannabis sativa]KAF4398157.1 hypothetical protein G4B88_019878 [Cannabis sativa]
MVGALALVGSSVVDSHTCPCLCVDALPSTNMNFKSVGDLGRKHTVKAAAGSSSSLDLSSSFIDSGHERRRLSAMKSIPAGIVISRSYRNQKKSNRRRKVVVSELGGQYEDTFEDVKVQILNYFTYKAVRTVMNQLYEMNPTQYRWFYDFVLTNKPGGDGKRFLRTLGKKCDHAEIYKEISDQNLELMRERLIETVIWPSDDTNTEKIG